MRDRNGERWSVGKGLRDYADDGGRERRNTQGNGRHKDDDAGERQYGEMRDYEERETWRPADESMQGGALVPIGDSENLPVVYDDGTGPVVIPGTGISMGNPFIKRRERPLTIRLGMIALMCCILVTGLFAVTPLGSSASDSISSFQAISGVVVWNKAPGFFWYTVVFGDTPENLAKKFNVQVGGIYELNNLLAGQELNVGTAYMIPTDAAYGKDYRPPSFLPPADSSGGNRFGNSPWTSYAGNPPPEMPCGVDGKGVPNNYQLKSPNWGAAWIRGFSWFHNGVDLSAANGNPEHAAQSGQVVWAGWDVGGLGWSVKIDNCFGISTVYGHMLKTLVKAGDPVTVGEVIGLEGSSGWSTGPHLHFMVEVNNTPVDPMAYYNYNEYQITHYVS